MLIHPITIWLAELTIADPFKIHIRRLDAQNHLWSEKNRKLQGGNIQVDTWEICRSIGDQHALFLPSTMPAGDYRITMDVENHLGERVRNQGKSEDSLEDEIVLGVTRIEKNKDSFAASQLVQLQPFR